MRVIYLLFFLLLISFSSFSQKSVFSPFTVNAEIKYSLDEDKRQDKILKNEESNTIIEAKNKSKIDTLKTKLDILKQRFEKFSILIDVVRVGQESTRSLTNIKNYQSFMITEVSNDPSLLIPVYQDALAFVDEGESLIRYLGAVCLSYNQIMGMDNGDRKMILNFILSELKRVELRSRNMYLAIKRRKMENQLMMETFRYYVNKDVQLVKDIINNAKKL